MQPLRLIIAMTLAAGCASGALAQSGGPSSGGPSSGGPSTGGPTTGAPSTATPPPSSMPAPATPSQRNLDTRPPATSVPPGETTAPPAAVLQPNTTPGATTRTRPGEQVPPSTGQRPTPGGAGSSQLSRENRTGKNPAHETFSSCIDMWEKETHMTRQQWARACRRVENRLQNLKIENLQVR